MSDPQWQLETPVHGGYRPDPTTRAVAVPIYQTVAYAFDDTQHGADLFDLKVPGNIYTRIMNPTTDVLEQRLAALKAASARAGAGLGQAAITYAIQTIAEAGDTIVASSALYGGSLNLLAHTLPQYGIQARFADPADPAAFGADRRTHQGGVRRIHRQPARQCHRHRRHRRGRACRRGAADRRQHGGYALPAAPVRARRRHRGAFADQVPGRARQQPRRRDHRFRPLRLGGTTHALRAAQPARPQLPRRGLYRS